MSKLRDGLKNKDVPYAFQLLSMSALEQCHVSTTVKYTIEEREELFNTFNELRDQLPLEQTEMIYKSFKAQLEFQKATQDKDLEKRDKDRVKKTIDEYLD